jgi:hypothetical protein
MFHINRRGAVLGLVVAAAALAAIGSAGATEGTPGNRQGTTSTEVIKTVPSVNLTSNDPGAVHGYLTPPIELATERAAVATTTAANQAGVVPVPAPAPLALDEPAPTSTTGVEPPSQAEIPIAIPISPTTDTPPSPPRSPENTPIVTPTLPPRE